MVKDSQRSTGWGHVEELNVQWRFAVDAHPAASTQHRTAADLYKRNINQSTIFKELKNNSRHRLLHSLLPDKNSRGYDLRRRRHDRILSHNDDQRNFVHGQFIHTVIKRFLVFPFYRLIAFWQFLVNEYVTLCYVTQSTCVRREHVA